MGLFCLVEEIVSFFVVAFLAESWHYEYYVNKIENNFHSKLPPLGKVPKRAPKPSTVARTWGPL